LNVKFVRETHCTNRLFEWYCAVVMTQIGAYTLVTYALFSSRPELAFLAFVKLGMSTVSIGGMFLTLGVARIVALIRNGKWDNGPLVRAVCSGIGVVLWGQLFYGIVHVLFSTGEFYLSFGVWDSMAVFEYVAFRRAIRDMEPADETLLTLRDTDG
jgi:hypothetical protein